MTNLERDEEIYKAILDVYHLEWQRKERLDSKISNFIAIAATIETLYMGLGFFILQQIRTSIDVLFVVLVITFLAGLGVFTSVIYLAVDSYKPTNYRLDPQPINLITKYSNRERAEIVQTLAANLAEATMENRQINDARVFKLNRAFKLMFYGILTMQIFACFVVLVFIAVAIN